VLFVRRPERRGGDGLLAFVARTTERERRLHRLELERHDDLVGVDLAAAGEPIEQPLFLVCTHGKHDRCCAKYGRPLYDAVREQVDEGWVWQSTHVGGDRFAGNVVVLPEGLFYGRVGEEDLDPILDDYFDGRINLERYRGRSAYTFAVQAAELAVREQTGLAGVRDVELLRVSRESDDRWLVTLRAEGREFAAEAWAEQGEEAFYLTCGAITPQRPRRFRARLR
jgi:hypothetical protein